METHLLNGAASVPSTEVAILGGGLAGLCAARRLHLAGVPFQLFEARDRLGGRILTVEGAGHPASDGFDLGPSWFWPHRQPGLAKLVAELALPVFAQHSDGDLVFERSLNLPPVRRDGAGQDQGSMRLAGGMGTLVRVLAEGLPKACVHLNAAVAELRLVPEGVRLTLGGNGEPTALWMARRILSTLPPRLMADAIRLDPAMDPATISRWRQTPTWMAPHAKFVAVYDRPFWHEAGLSGMAHSLVGPLAEIHDATTATGTAALFGFVGVPAASRAGLSQDALTRAALGQLARLFGPQAAAPRATLLKDWATDPFTSTRADSAASGHPTAPHAPMITGAWSERFILAGSETSMTEPGYLAGAVDAAERAALALINPALAWRTV